MCAGLEPGDTRPLSVEYVAREADGRALSDDVHSRSRDRDRDRSPYRRPRSRSPVYGRRSPSPRHALRCSTRFVAPVCSGATGEDCQSNTKELCTRCSWVVLAVSRRTLRCFPVPYTAWGTLVGPAANGEHCQSCNERKCRMRCSVVPQLLVAMYSLFSFGRMTL